MSVKVRGDSEFTKYQEFNELDLANSSDDVATVISFELENP